MPSTTTTTRTSSPLSFLILSLFTLILIEPRTVLSDDLIISSANDLIDFSNNVNNGQNYSGTTVYLATDIDFSAWSLSSQFGPIGESRNSYFLGTFDGQGYRIDGLVIRTQKRYVGLFGYTHGSIIRNLVLGPSSSVVCSYSSNEIEESTYVGGILGRCGEGDCTIENNVNMANVTFDGSMQVAFDRYLYLGGVVGRFDQDYTRIVVRNCANYGKIELSGEAHYARIGGIISRFSGNSSIQNCANYGEIAVLGLVFREVYIGGIAGRIPLGGDPIIENCVSAGKIDTSQAAFLNKTYVGTVVSWTRDGVTISNCYWSKDVGYDKIFGRNEANVSDSSLFTDVNSTLLTALNEYDGDGDTVWSRWLRNEDRSGVKFVINKKEALISSSQVILLPTLASGNGRTFHGWYSDPDCSTEFVEDTITRETTLYGFWEYTVSFDVNGGDALEQSNKDVAYGTTYGDLPAPSRTGHTFGGWFTEKNESITSESMVTIPNSHTLYAHWTVNKYHVTFDFANGTVVVREHNYGEVIEFPEEDLTREGYTFGGWNTSSAATAQMTVPDHNITLRAIWVAARVEITFGKKDLTEEAVKEIISEYTDSEFVIVRIDVVGDEVVVIVGFSDPASANDFVRKAEESGKDSLIKRVEIVRDGGDFAPTIFVPFFLFFL